MRKLNYEQPNTQIRRAVSKFDLKANNRVQTCHCVGCLINQSHAFNLRKWTRHFANYIAISYQSVAFDEGDIKTLY